MNETERENVRAAVRAQYGAIARSTAQTGCATSCCGPGPAGSAKLGYAPEDLAVAEGANLGLGCGNPQAIAALVAGETVLDLGAGAGFDCFLAARRVGPTGRVVGVDMTADMVSKARANAATLGAVNVEFRLGEIEHLPIQDASVDVILSNCVINLSPDKRQVFVEAFRVLRPGGRLAISDVVALAPIPPKLEAEVVALVGCVAGAATVDVVESYLKDAGFIDVRLEVNPGSSDFIRDWVPGSGAERYVASATIRATKPGGERCCGPACCTTETGA